MVTHRVTDLVEDSGCENMLNRKSSTRRAPMITFVLERFFFMSLGFAFFDASTQAMKDGGLPSACYPSDHLSIMAELQWPKETQDSD